MKALEISKELLREVLGINDIVHVQNEGSCSIFISRANNPAYIINIYELAFMNLKQWAKLKNVFNIIDWSEEPEQIIKKVEKIRNEIN